MVGTIAGIVVATFLNNSGGAWDNAKKYIETGRSAARAHRPTRRRRRDTVEIPSRTPAGPSLHVLIKLLATIRSCSRRYLFDVALLCWERLI